MVTANKPLYGPVHWGIQYWCHVLPCYSLKSRKSALPNLTTMSDGPCREEDRANGWVKQNICCRNAGISPRRQVLASSVQSKVSFDLFLTYVGPTQDNVHNVLSLCYVPKITCVTSHMNIMYLTPYNL